jgi:flagellin-like hook-associated protein FlgL
MIIQTSNSGSLSGYSATLMPAPFYGIKNKGTLVANYRTKVDSLKVDSLFLSDIGKRFHFRGAEITDKWSQITSSGSNWGLRAMDSHISKTGKLLENMKSLAESAQDETLTDLDRIDIQIEIGQLQHSLKNETEVLRRKLIGLPNTMADPFESTSEYKMLERARQRIVNGEKWDVAEVLTPIAAWDDELGWHVKQYELEIADDEGFATVSDYLKANGRSVMDSDSAKMSAVELEKELYGLAEQREKLIAFIDKNGGNPKESATRQIGPLSSKLVRFLQSLSKEMHTTSTGNLKDEQGNYKEAVTLMDTERVQDESESLSELLEYKTSEALKIQVRLNTRQLVGHFESLEVIEA